MATDSFADFILSPRGYEASGLLERSRNFLTAGIISLHICIRQ